MRTLVIDCASQACSIALFDGSANNAGTCIAGAWEVIGRGHAERLVPMIAALPNKGKAARIAVSLGPGSFTGVRIGVAAARALGLAWQAQVMGYPTLALIAAQARDGAALPVSVCTTGGHGQWFVQNFSADGLPECDSVSVAPKDATGLARHHRVGGDQAAALTERRGHGEAIDLLPDARMWNLLSAALSGPSVMPIYGRGPDARLPA